MLTITTRQLKLIGALMIFFAVIRYGVLVTVNEAGGAGWVAVILPAAIYFFVFGAFSKIYAKDKATFVSVARESVGRVAADGMLLLYALFMIITAASCLTHTNFSLRSSSYTFGTSDLVMGVSVVAMAVFMAAGLNKLARISEIVFYLLFAAFAGWVILLVPHIDIGNLYPVSTLDILPVLKGSGKMLGVWAFGSFALMLGGNTGSRTDMKKVPLFLTVFTAAAALASFAVCVGALGAPLAQRFTFSTLLSVKIIEISSVLQRFEAIIVFVWFMADFITIAMSVMVAVMLISEVFALKNNIPLVLPVFALAYFLSASMLKSSFDFWVFSDKILLYANAFVGIFFPLLIFTVGKIRKKL